MEDVNNQTTDKNNKEEKDWNDNEEEEEESNPDTPTPTPACHPPINIVTQQQSSKGSHASQSSKNTESMASVLAEIRRETEEETAESNETVARLPNSAANHSRATCTSGSTSTARHGNGSSHATSADESDKSEQEYDNSDDVEDDDNDIGYRNDTALLDEDLAKTAKYLKLYFTSLAKSGTVRTVEEESTLVTANSHQF